MAFRNILDSVTKLRKDLQNKRRFREGSRSVSPQLSLYPSSAEVLEENHNEFSKKIKKDLFSAGNRNEHIGKYRCMNCQLQRPSSRLKAYKFDAAELIFFSIRKKVRKYFLDVRTACLKKNEGWRKVSSVKFGRGRSTDGIQKHLNILALRTESSSKSRFVRKMDEFNSGFEKIAYVIKLKLNHSAWKSLLSWNYAKKYIQLLDTVVKAYKKRLCDTFSSMKLLIHEKCKLLKPIYSSTPKFVSPSSYQSKIKVGADFSSLQKVKHLPRPLHSTKALTPGRIYKTNLLLNTDANRTILEDNERNPTFGDDSEDDSQKIMAEIKTDRKNFRNTKVNKTLKELKCNPTQNTTKILHKSHQLSLGSLTNLKHSNFNSDCDYSFIKNSLLTNSPRKLSRPQQSMLLTTSTRLTNISSMFNSKELWNGDSRYPSFEKYSSVVKLTKESDDSTSSSAFHSLRNLHEHDRNIFRRRNFIERLGALCKLEEVFYSKYLFEAKFIIAMIRISLNEDLICKVLKVFYNRYKEILEKIKHSRSKRVYMRGIRQLCERFGNYYIKLKAYSYRKWILYTKCEL